MPPDPAKVKQNRAFADGYYNTGEPVVLRGTYPVVSLTHAATASSTATGQRSITGRS
jgi:hypothetical protein